MALISCPECNKRVSDKAPQCPNCGSPIADGAGGRKSGGEGSSAGEHRPFKLTKPTGGVGGVLGGLLSGIGKLIVVMLIVAGLAVGVPALLKGLSESDGNSRFEKIQIGMTLNEVENILGKPNGGHDDMPVPIIIPGKPHDGKPATPVGFTYHWNNGTGSIVVSFRDGKVTNKVHVRPK